jgi:hypothetical protein
MSPTISPRRLRAALFLLSGLAMAALCRPPSAHAADFGAKTNGNWSSSTTWTPSGGPPGAGDNAYIGSTYPNGAAASATVMLTQNQQANTVVLGYGAGTSGTLNLGNFSLTATNFLLGFNGGTGAVTRGTGFLNVGTLQLSGSTLALSASDRTGVLILSDASSATTAVTANVTDGVRVRSGSTLTLGADLSAGGLFNSYSIEVSGANSTLNAQGHKITTPVLSIGWEYVNQTQVPGTHVVNFLNRGDLDVRELFVANQALNLTATDRVSSYHLANGSTTFAPGATVYSLYMQGGSTATTTAVGNITGVAGVWLGSTLTLGADLNLTSGVDVSGDNSTLNAQGHRITAPQLYLGWGGGANVRLLNRGALVVTDLLVANQNFNLTSTDQVTNFYLSNAATSLGAGVAVQRLGLQDAAAAATSAAGNITRSVDLATGSTLTLGADLSVSEYVSVLGVNSTINAQGHAITTPNLTLGWEGGPAQLQNKGALAVNTLWVANQTLNLGAADQVAGFQLINGSSNLGTIAGIQSLSLMNGSTAVTAAPGNLTGTVEVSGSTLTLGADLTVSGLVRVSGDNSTLDAQFHKITAGTLDLGSQGGTNVRFLNKGVLDVTNLVLGGQNMNLSAADRVVNLDVRSAPGGIGSTASTAVTANVTGSANVSYNSTLTLGADLNVTGAVNVGFDNSTLNAQGHNITADSLSLGFFNVGENVRLLNRGNLTVTNLYVANQNFNLTTADRVTNFSLIWGNTNLGAGVSVQSLGLSNDATATTTAAGNITGSVYISNNSRVLGSRLTLGADLNLSGSIYAWGHTVTIDAQGHNITAGSLTLEYYPYNQGDPNIRLLNEGAITIGGVMALAGGVQVELRGGNDSARSLLLSENSGLRIKSAATGFTITGATADDLLFNGTSTLTLELNGSQPGWVLRWANPNGGNHIADLNALIAQDMIVFSVTNGGQFNIVSQNGYTYIVQPVPEPGLILLIAAPAAVGLCLRRRA